MTYDAKRLAKFQVVSLGNLLIATGWTVRTEAVVHHGVAPMLPAHDVYTVAADRGLEHLLAFWSAWDDAPGVPAHTRFDKAIVSRPYAHEAEFHDLADLREHLRVIAVPAVQPSEYSTDQLLSALANAPAGSAWADKLAAEVRHRMTSEVWVKISAGPDPFTDDTVTVTTAEQTAYTGERVYHAIINGSVMRVRP